MRTGRDRSMSIGRWKRAHKERLERKERGDELGAWIKGL